MMLMIGGGKKGEKAEKELSGDARWAAAIGSFAHERGKRKLRNTLLP